MRAGREEGYVLLGVVIGIIVLGIFMGAAVPLWQKVMQREREKELIFRGYQYMQAIELYQRKFPGAFPPSIEVLVEQKFLRQEYEDPMTEDGEWRVLRQLSPELQMGGAQQQREAGARAGLTDLNRSRAQMGAPGGQTFGQTRNRPLTGGQFQSSMGRGPGDASLGGIVGVASRSEEETFYKVPGKETYEDWLFVYGVQPAAVPVQLPGQGPVQPGQRPGQPTQPAGQVPAQLPGQSNNLSPFPGLPPPPGLTSFRFGSAPVGPIPDQPGAMPGMAPQPGQPGQPFQPGQRPPGFGTSPSGSGFGSSPGSSFGPQQQPRQQRPPDDRRP